MSFITEFLKPNSSVVENDKQPGVNLAAFAGEHVSKVNNPVDNPTGLPGEHVPTVDDHVGIFGIEYLRACRDELDPESDGYEQLGKMINNLQKKVELVG